MLLGGPEGDSSISTTCLLSGALCDRPEPLKVKGAGRRWQANQETGPRAPRGITPGPSSGDSIGGTGQSLPAAASLASASFLLENLTWPAVKCHLQGLPCFHRAVGEEGEE